MKEKKPPIPNTATETTYGPQNKPLLCLQGATFRPFKMSPGKAWAIVENYTAIKAFAAKHMARPSAEPTVQALLGCRDGKISRLVPEESDMPVFSFPMPDGTYSFNAPPKEPK